MLTNQNSKLNYLKDKKENILIDNLNFTFLFLELVENKHNEFFNEEIQINI